MNTIKLYKPKFIDVEILFPSEWDELYPAEIELIASLMQSEIQQDDKKRTILFNGILGVRGQKNKIKVPKNILDLLDPEQAVIHVFPLLEWIFISNKLTKQPYVSFPLPGLRSTTVYGPLDDFDNLTCGEYEDAEVFFFEFNETGRLEALAHLAAILYRPKGNAYIKIKNSVPEVYKHEKRLQNFMRLPKERLLAIWLWFTGCRNMMTLYFPYVFGSQNGAAGKQDKLSFTKCIHAGAGPKNGSRQQVRLLPIKEFFFDMNEEARAIKDLKK